MAGFWSRIKSVFRSILSLFTQRKHPCWPESAAPLPPLGAETEEALGRVDWSKWDVLVGSLTTAAQLEHNLQGNYYHVPACYVPEEALPVRYVPFTSLCISLVMRAAFAGTAKWRLWSGWNGGRFLFL